MSNQLMNTNIHSALSLPDLRERATALRCELLNARAKQLRLAEALTIRRQALIRLEAELAMREPAPAQSDHE